ncbi:hypothetical protein [uncultured Phocaeicola sp.]|uniref:hypothetical protein n=1 Tax=uncultured Phocaeicola sp. TaxID=990718 RepID=UPI0015AD9E54|nr:hypothetical protein [uncultured Phocaeicola sp.]
MAESAESSILYNRYIPPTENQQALKADIFQKKYELFLAIKEKALPLQPQNKNSALRK